MAYTPDHVLYTDPIKTMTDKVNTAMDGIQSVDQAKLNVAGGTMTGALLLFEDPVQATEAATKAYVDSVAQGLAPKDPAVAMADSNITLSGTGQVIDGVTINNGDRVLVNGQTDATTNGIYVASSAGAWSLASDFNTSAEVKPGSFVFVSGGTKYANSGFVVSGNSGQTITLGTSPIHFVQYSGAGEITAGNGLSKNGNTLAVVTGQPNGVAGLDGNGVVPVAQLPPLNYIPTSSEGVANGVATLDANGKVTSTQLPSLDYIPLSDMGAANGVATLDGTGKVVSTQLPPLNYLGVDVAGRLAVKSVDGSNNMWFTTGLGSEPGDIAFGWKTDGAGNVTQINLNSGSNTKVATNLNVVDDGSGKSKWSGTIEADAGVKHTSSGASHSFTWQYNATTNSLDLVYS